MRKCCEGDGLLTLLLNFPSFQSQLSDSSLSERSSKLCKSSLSGTQPLSKQDSKTASTRYTTGSGNLAVPGDVLGISEHVGVPEVSVQGPSACGYIPTFTNPIPIYG